MVIVAQKVKMFQWSRSYDYFQKRTAWPVSVFTDSSFIALAVGRGLFSVFQTVRNLYM